MRKLSFAFILALSQSAIALALVIWSRHIPDRGFSYARIYVPILLDACRGVSAPVLFPTRSVEILAVDMLHLPWAIPLGAFELPLEAVLFPVCVFALWFAVGRVVEGGWARSSHYLDATTKEKLVLDSLLVLYGVFLFSVGVAGIWEALRFWRQSPLTIQDVRLVRIVIWSYLSEGILPTLVLAWSLPLLFVPGQKLIARARNNDSLPLA